MSEFLVHLQGDSIRNMSKTSLNVMHLKNIDQPLRLLIENEIFRATYIIVWAPVTPMIAVTFSERRHGNDPLLLQYAHGVLKQHPVDLTFFFVPQVVQALRFDDPWIYRTVHLRNHEVSQFFCHQIIWNMKANCF
ncbi:hypothetical protein F4604DRAFT_1933017 [Suillus subluteus]|nr:hypothetical protein F4604DRAFT_1933017 [Suillus subluteus]